MKLYYKTELGELWCGDCIDLMREFRDDKFDLCLADPPYGIGADKAAAKNEGKWGWKDYGMTEWDKSRPSKEYFEEMMRISRNQIIWGGNYFVDYLYPSSGWLVWDKGQRDFSLADAELAWTSYNKALRIIEVSRARAMKDGKRHPTQKSIEVISKCIQYAGAVETVIDTYLGSGVTAIVCERLKIKWVGCEISEDYCEIAKKWLLSESNQGRLL